jgi:hypothetical protein
MMWPAAPWPAAPWPVAPWLAEQEWLWEGLGGQASRHCLWQVLRLRWLDYS